MINERPSNDLYQYLLELQEPQLPYAMHQLGLANEYVPGQVPRPLTKHHNAAHYVTPRHSTRSKLHRLT